MIDLLFGKNEAANEASAAEFYGFNIILNVLALGLALAVEDLAMILSINGAVCTNFVAFILPAAFFIKVRTDADKWYHQIPYVLLLCFGICSLVLCTAQI
jgi:amino acid permease